MHGDNSCRNDEKSRAPVREHGGFPEKRKHHQRQQQVEGKPDKGPHQRDSYRALVLARVPPISIGRFDPIDARARHRIVSRFAE